MNYRHVPSLPEPIAAFVAATNLHDLEALLATFVDDALVNDQFQEYWGKQAICIWATHEIIGASLHMAVMDSYEHYGHVIVCANVDGTFSVRELKTPPNIQKYYRIVCFNAFAASDICVITVSTEQFNTLAMSSREHLKRYASSNITRCSVGRCRTASAIRLLRSAGT
jgi:hypothetical protein